MQETPISAITSYHAHIYFRDGAEREVAMAIRQAISERFAVALGRVHDRLVGPHTAPMYQVAFNVEDFARLLPWLMLNRGGLSILLHPNTRFQKQDHLTTSFWLGDKLPLINTDQLEDEAEPEGRVVPNTVPTLGG
jgi:DOPA 4,5-dioxygenase